MDRRLELKQTDTKNYALAENGRQTENLERGFFARRTMIALVAFTSCATIRSRNHRMHCGE